MAEGNRDRLGPAEQEGSFEQEQKGRDQDCPKRIDMLERVERDAAQPKGGVIPKLPGRVCVRRFMERDRDKDRNGPGRGCVEEARKLQDDLLQRPIDGGPPLGLSTPTSGRVSRAASTITLVRRGSGGNCCPALKDATGSARCWAHGCERGVQPRLGLTYYHKAEQNAVPSITPACEGDTKEFGPEREKGAERESRAGPQCSLRKLPQRWAADTQAISQGVVQK